jgi:two-component sensor histidine kinase
VNTDRLSDHPVFLTLAPQSDSAATARHFALRVTDGELEERQRDDMELLVSELVSNAVLHARTAVQLMLCREGSGVRVEVSDESPVIPRRRAQTGASGGFGMRLLAELSHTWGIEVRPHGKTIWFCI